MVDGAAMDKIKVSRYVATSFACLLMVSICTISSLSIIQISKKNFKVTHASLKVTGLIFQHFSSFITNIAACLFISKSLSYLLMATKLV